MTYRQKGDIAFLERDNKKVEGMAVGTLQPADMDMVEDMEEDTLLEEGMAADMAEGMAADMAADMGEGMAHSKVEELVRNMVQDRNIVVDTTTFS